MQFQYTSYVLPLFLVGAICIWVAYYAWSHRSVSGAFALTFLALSAGIWAISYALEIAGFDQATKVVWSKVEYLGVTTAPLLWLVFCYNYFNQNRQLPLRVIAILGILPLITLLLTFTTEYHGLIWRQYYISRTGDFSSLGVIHGFWFWVYWIYGNLLMVIGTYFMTMLIRHKHGLYRGQIAALIVAAAAPWVGNFLYVTGLTPVESLDLTPFGFTVAVISTAWGIFRFQLINLVPLARDTVVEAMETGMIVLDAHGQVADINRAAATMIGLPVEQVMHKPAMEVLNRWPHLTKKYEHVLDALDEILIDEDGRQRWFELSLSPLRNREKAIIGRLITLRDITAVKQTQEALLLARDQAQQASRFKSDLLSRVSHELRTPLFGILGYAELLRDQALGSLSENQNRAVETIIESTNYLTTVISDLMDQAQIEAKKLVLHFGECSPGELLRNLEEMMTVLAQKRGLTLRTILEPGVPALVYSDEQRLRQILINLVANAIKFTKQGEVCVRIFQPSPTHWAIQVSDTGIGIPKEAQATIFEPFQKVQSSPTRDNRGTGLGLSITKQLIDLLDGQIVLTSEVGKGSTFLVTLPINRVMR